MRCVTQIVIALWCVAGVIALCIAINPLLFRFANMVTPVDGVPWDSGDATQIVYVWFVTIVAVGLLILAVAVMAYLIECVFGTGDSTQIEQTTESQPKK